MSFFHIAIALLSLGVLALSSGFTNSSRCDAEAALGSRLSPEASIIFPSDPSFDELLVRASSPRVQPIFSVVVEPATQEDVQHTLMFANECNLPFLTVSSGHGWQTTLNNASGIQINMHKMQQLSLSESGDTVHVGGGTQQKVFVETLFDWGKESVTANCECSAVIGPLMGGGHAALQGQHGYVADGLVSAQVVLWDGTAVTASQSQHSDLFWALKGAGHNFGVITSFELKAYDLPKKNWTITNMVFTQDKLEAWIDATNEVDNLGDHDSELVLQGSAIRNPSADANNPVISWRVCYQGTPEEAEPYIQRYREVGPLSVTQTTNVTYEDFFVAIRSSLADQTCARDRNLFAHASSLPSYKKTAMRTAFGYFSELTDDTRYELSAWLLENYGMRGVRAQDWDASAIPHAERELAIVTSPVIYWDGNDTEARQKADKYSRMMRAALAEGEETKDPHVYLNYATGNERLEQVYGQERLSRLRAIKKKYDPKNKFGFYMGIV